MGDVGKEAGTSGWEAGECPDKNRMRGPAWPHGDVHMSGCIRMIWLDELFTWF
jgi:hypothetical protein